MLTLIEIEKAVEGLSKEEKVALRRYLEQTIEPSSAAPATRRTHSVLDIPAIKVGPVLYPFDASDDLLGEMLEGRQ